MATKASRSAARMMISPAVILLLCWMIVPLVMTIYFSFLRYNLITPSGNPFVGWENYYWFFTDPSFSAAMVNTLVLVGGVLVITTVGGIMFALLLDKPMWGQGIIRIMVIAPFFVMPTVSALVWKNMFMNPVNGVFGRLATSLGFQPIDFFGQIPLASWTSRFIYIMLPHLARAITVVILIQTIFLLSIFAEILVTTNGGPGTATTNLTYLIYVSSLLQYDVGIGSAGGVVAIILANIVAFFLMRMIGKNLDA